MADASTTTVIRSDDREWTQFTPTSEFSFISTGGPGVPEFFEERSRRGDGPPLHAHPWPTWELVLEGRVRFHIDGEDVMAEAGDVVYTPPGVAHSYIVESDEARLVGVGTSDGRFPRLQMAAAPLFMDPNGPDMGQVAQLAADAGLDLLGPPLSEVTP